MAKHYAISVHDMNRKKLYDLYDSAIEVDGELRDISISTERSGWKEVNFSIDRKL